MIRKTRYGALTPGKNHEAIRRIGKYYECILMINALRNNQGMIGSEKFVIGRHVDSESLHFTYCLNQNIRRNQIAN